MSPYFFREHSWGDTWPCLSWSCCANRQGPPPCDHVRDYCEQCEGTDGAPPSFIEASARPIWGCCQEMPWTGGETIWDAREDEKTIFRPFGRPRWEPHTQRCASEEIIGHQHGWWARTTDSHRKCSPFTTQGIEKRKKTTRTRSNYFWQIGVACFGLYLSEGSICGSFRFGSCTVFTFPLFVCTFPVPLDSRHSLYV